MTVKLVKWVSKQSTKSLPEEIQKLVDDARQTLTQEQGEKFLQLILDYKDIFSTKDEPLGRTDVVRHDIKTSGPPIKSQYR